MSLSDKLQDKYGKPHLSYSSMKKALTDLSLFDMHMKGVRDPQSDALEFGTMYDMLLFDNKKAHEVYRVVDDGYILERCSLKTQESKSPSMTNEFKEVKAAIMIELHEKGHVICSEKDWDAANLMVKRLKDCGIVETYLNGDYQKEIYQEIDGVLVKGYIDCFGGHYISDSKSTRSVEGFRYDVNKLCYDIQAYIYCKATGIEEFYWVVQEKTFPYLPAVVKCTEETLFRGEMKFQSAVSKINAFMDGQIPEANKDYMIFEV